MSETMEERAWEEVPERCRQCPALSRKIGLVAVARTMAQESLHTSKTMRGMRPASVGNAEKEFRAAIDPNCAGVKSDACQSKKA